MEHVAVGLAQVIGAPSRTGLKESRSRACSRTCVMSGDRTPVVGVCRQQARSLFNARMSFGQLFHGHCALADHDVAGMNRVVRDLALVQRREQPTFADHKDRAAWVCLAEEISGVQSGCVKMTGRKPWDAQMPEAHG